MDIFLLIFIIFISLVFLIALILTIIEQIRIFKFKQDKNIIDKFFNCFNNKKYYYQLEPISLKYDMPEGELCFFYKLNTQKIELEYDNNPNIFINNKNKNFNYIGLNGIYTNLNKIKNKKNIQTLTDKIFLSNKRIIFNNNNLNASIWLKQIFNLKWTLVLKNNFFISALIISIEDKIFIIETNDFHFMLTFYKIWNQDLTL